MHHNHAGVRQHCQHRSSVEHEGATVLGNQLAALVQVAASASSVQWLGLLMRT